MSKIYQLKITLKDVKPPVWRRLEISEDTKLDKLDKIIRAAMGWGGWHLTSFEFARVEYYGDRESALDMDGELMSKTKLSQCLKAENQKGLYTYDFGDDWRHEILLEKILDARKGREIPPLHRRKTRLPAGRLRRCLGLRGLFESHQRPQTPGTRGYAGMDWGGVRCGGV